MFVFMLVWKAAEEWALVSIELNINKPCSDMMSHSDFVLAVDFSCARQWSKLYLLILLPLFIAVDLEIHRAYWQVSLPAHESNGVYSSRYRNHHSYSC